MIQIYLFDSFKFLKREFLKFSNPDFKPTNILEENYKEECLKLKYFFFRLGPVHISNLNNNFNLTKRKREEL